MSKFACPKCGYGATTTTHVVEGRKETTRYRHCRICNANFATAEMVKDTPRTRSWIGPEKAAALWGEKPFKYRTIKQQKRVLENKVKSST